MRLFKTLLIALLLAGTTTAAGAIDSAQEINIDVKEFQLNNGMLFLVVQRPTTPQVAVRLAIRAGSALEEVGKTGIAHLLEHMMFKGTKNFGTLDVEKDQALQAKIEAAYQAILVEEQKRHPDQAIIQKNTREMERLRAEVQKIYVPQAFSSQLGKNGAVGVNAFTTKDQTQYLASVPADMLEQWFSIISEQIFEPSWREFYVEKQVVHREWAFRYVNNPSGAAWLDLNTAAYTAHPYRNPTIGWKSDMDAYNTQDAMAFHQRYYNPTNVVCVLVGDIEIEEVKRLAGIYFERYPAGPRSPERVTAEPQQTGPRSSIRYLKGARTPLVRIGFHAAGMGTEDFYALDAMTMVLSHGRSARMTQNIINKGLAVQAWAYNPDNRYGGMVILGGSPNEPAALQTENLTESEKREAYLQACRELEKILLSEMDKMKDQPVSEKELERIKKLNERDFLDRMRSNEDLAGTLATLEVQIGWRYLTDYLRKVAAVTPEDIQTAARKYLHRENRTSVFVIPGGKPDKPPAGYAEVRSISGSAAANMARPTHFENISIYPTPQAWKHPLSFDRNPQKIVYPRAETAQIGSTKLFYMADNELPLVDLTILVKAGAVDIEKSKTGLAGLLNGSLIRGGTQKLAPAALALALDENAIQVSVSVNEEVSAIHLSVLKDDWEKGLALLEEILTRPAFDARVLQVVKEQVITDLRRQGGDAQAVAMREAMIWHFGDHPYGRDPLLGLKTIADIDREDLLQFLNTYFVASNMVVAVAGDIAEDKAVSDIRKLLSALPDHPAPRRRLDDPKPTPPVLALIHKPGQVQSQVILALPSVKRTHPDFWKIRLLMDIFGGSDSLLYTRLRDDLGLVYSAGFFQTYKWNAGLLVGYIGCKGDRTPTALLETVKIMRSLQKDVPRQDMALKRLEALNSFVFNVDTPMDLVTTYSRYHLRGEPLDTLEKIQQAYLEADRTQLLDLANTHLNAGALQIFVVADKTTPLNRTDTEVKTLEDDLKVLANKLGLPYREIELR
jgi:predicted Zn-dependent peptidase